VNSAREVVARMLKDFSDNGLVEVKRGLIKLRDIDGLKKRVSAP
jgi:CRP/FNR family transcriptional regulator